MSHKMDKAQRGGSAPRIKKYTIQNVEVIEDTEDLVKFQGCSVYSLFSAIKRFLNSRDFFCLFGLIYFLIHT